ncbi:hypothetical protein [Mycoplasma sp. P36-A1]
MDNKTTNIKEDINVGFFSFKNRFKDFNHNKEDIIKSIINKENVM